MDGNSAPPLATEYALEPAVRERVTAQDRVYYAVRHALTTGELRRGQRLKEEVLARRYNVSRTPLREALRKLVQDGLLVASPFRGVIVREHSLSEAQQLFELRATLEAFAARAASQRASAAELAQIRARLEEAEQTLLIDDADALLQTNMRLHMEIARASHNTWLFNVLEDLHAHFGLLRVTALGHGGRRQEVNREHRALVRAIVKRDESEAERLAQEHMQLAWQFMRSSGQLDGPALGEAEDLRPAERGKQLAG